MAKVTALIPAAGQGRRMGLGINKAYIEIGGRPLLAYTLDKFQSHSLIDDIIVIAQKDDLDFCRREIVLKYGFTKIRSVVAGGRERQDSVYLGLAALSPDTGWVVIHDGARPLINPHTITLALETAQAKGSAVVGVPSKETIKVINPDLSVKETPERHSLWMVQTPQVFARDILVKAHKKALTFGWTSTDDAMLVERVGAKVYMVQGEYSNIKVTTPEDLLYVKEYLRTEL